MKFVLTGLIVVIITILINGCQPQPQTATAPYLTNIEVKPNFVRLGGNIEINYLVNNPLTVAFQGKVTYKSNCFLYGGPSDKEIAVSSNSPKPFQSTSTISNSKDCVGIQQIILTLQDKDAKTIDSKAVNINVVE